MKYALSYFLLIIGILSFFSCKMKNDSLINQSIDNKVIAKQFKDTLTKIICSGNFEIPSTSITCVCPPIAGYLKSKPLIIGRKVAQGEVIAVIEHANIIEIQQKYLETLAKLEYYSEEFKRQGELTVENAASIKKMQQAQSDYKALESNMICLQKQLTLLGIKPDEVKTQNITSTIQIKSPISGIITQSESKYGMYLAAEHCIYEIAPVVNSQLYLTVNEADISFFDINKNISFYCNTDSNNYIQAKVQSVVAQQNTNPFVYQVLLQPLSKISTTGHTNITIIKSNK